MSRMPSEVKDLRKKIKHTDLSYRQIFEATGISKGWFMRTIRGDFHEPNPEWMAKINQFIDEYQALREKFNVR